MIMISPCMLDYCYENDNLPNVGDDLCIPDITQNELSIDAVRWARKRDIQFIEITDSAIVCALMIHNSVISFNEAIFIAVAIENNYECVVYADLMINMCKQHNINLKGVMI